MSQVLLVALAVIAGLFGLFALYLLVVAVVPGLKAPAQELERRPPPTPDDPPPPLPKLDLEFEVDGLKVAAWLYRPPAGDELVPCVVMACGAGGTRDMGMERYARRLVAAGYAALVFDYRHFGASEGEPRQLMWIPFQLADIAAAVRYARGLAGIDPRRVTLWGTSLAGGHVMAVAAADRNLSCVIAQCPALDGRAQALKMHRSGHGGFGIFVRAQRDLVRSWLGLSAAKVPIVGRPGTLALMTDPDVYDAFARMAPPGFVNEVCARIAIRGDKYRPITRVKKISRPVLIQICERDTLTPIEAAEEAAAILGGLATLKRYPIGHFDIYFGDDFERAVADQLEFLSRHMPVRAK